MACAEKMQYEQHCAECRADGDRPPLSYHDFILKGASCRATVTAAAQLVSAAKSQPCENNGQVATARVCSIVCACVYGCVCVRIAMGSCTHAEQPVLLLPLSPFLLPHSSTASLSSSALCANDQSASLRRCETEKWLLLGAA
jgi:hypothetical protein